MYNLEGDQVYYQDEKMKQLVGSLNKTDTIRIDNNTVADVSYQFDFGVGRYLEHSRVTRNEPVPISEVDLLKEEISFLRERDARMQDDISSIIEGLTGGV